MTYVVKDGYFSGLISMNIFNDSGGTQKNLVIIHWNRTSSKKTDTNS